jgi:hypothetical protein
VSDDWRIRIDLPREARVFDFPLDLSDEARTLANELEGRRLAVSRDGDTIFVYAETREEAERARVVVEMVLRDEGLPARPGEVERWLPDEERWDGDPAGPTIEEELVTRGYAPWEVRVELPTHREARALADRLEEEGWDVTRRWRYLVVGAATREQAEELAARVRNAGSIFLGSHTPEAIGDYVGGPNHVLPTARSARFSSGLGVLDFMKRTSILKCDAGALHALGPAAITLGRSEGLEGHARSIAIRLNL